MKRWCGCVLVFGLIQVLLGGCEVWHSLFSASEEEAREAVVYVLNVFADTSPFVTEECLAYDQPSGLFTYTNAEGTFTCQYTVDEMVQTFDGYEPLFSGYSIAGELSTSRVSIGGDDIVVDVSGTLELSGGDVTSLAVATFFYKAGDTIDFHGEYTANGRNFSDLEEWSLEEVILRNVEIMMELREIAAR